MPLEANIFSSLFPALDARQKSPRSTMDVRATDELDGMPLLAPVADEYGNSVPLPQMPQPSVEEITAAINAPLMYGTEQLYGGTEDVTETVSTPTFTDTSSIQGTVTDPNAYKPLYDAPQNEYESSQEALRKNLYDIQNPQNKDKGVKGFLKEGLENFLFGLSHAKDGMGFWESMAMGGSGFGMGIANRGANERRAALRNTPLLQEAVKQAEGRQRLEIAKENEEFDRLYKRGLLGERESERERKERKDARDFEIKEKTLNFKIADRDEYYRLEEIKQDALQRNRKDLYELAAKKQQELERHNKVTEETSREKGKPKNNVPLSPPSVTAPQGKKNPKDPMGLFK